MGVANAVILYVSAGGRELFFKHLVSEKDYVDHMITDPGDYYYCLAQVDTEGNLSDLSQAVKVRIE